MSYFVIFTVTWFSECGFCRKWRWGHKRSQKHNLEAEHWPAVRRCSEFLWEIFLLMMVELGAYHKLGHIRNYMLLVFASACGHLIVTVRPQLRSTCYMRASRETVHGVKKWVIVSIHHPKPWGLRSIDWVSVLTCHRLQSLHFTNPEGIWDPERLVTCPRWQNCQGQLRSHTSQLQVCVLSTCLFMSSKWWFRLTKISSVLGTDFIATSLGW